MDIKSFLVGLAVGALLAVSGGWLYLQEQEKDHAQEVAAANARAANFELAWDAYRNAYTDLATQHLEAEALLNELQERNPELARALEESEATVLSLQDQVSTLEAKLDSSATEASQEDSVTYRIDLDESVWLAGGGNLRVHGPITLRVEPISVATDLSVLGRFPVTVVISEDGSGDLRVDAFTGDPRLSISTLDVQGLAREPAGGSSGFAGFLAGQLTGAEAWVNRILGGIGGYLVCQSTRR